MGYASDVGFKYWATAETTYDTAVAIVATDAVDLEDLKIEPAHEYVKSVQHTGTASLQTEIEGTRGGKWSAVAYVKPAALGTPPDIGPAMLKAAFGTETISGGASVTYVLNDALASTVGASLQIARASTIDNQMMEIINGAWVEQVDIELTAGQPPKISMSGGFASYGWVYGGATVSSASPGAATVTSSVAGVVGVGGRLAFTAATNSGAGYTCTAVSGTTITISPVLHTDDTLAGTESILPFYVTSTLGGSIVGGINGACTIGGTSVGVRSGKVSIKTGVKPVEGQATTNRPVGLFLSEREIGGELEFYLENATGPKLGLTWVGTTAALVWTIGSAAAARIKINAPVARFGSVPIEVSRGEVAVFKLPFVARQSAAAGDEMTWLFD